MHGGPIAREPALGIVDAYRLAAPRCQRGALYRASRELTRRELRGLIAEPLLFARSRLKYGRDVIPR